MRINKPAHFAFLLCLHRDELAALPEEEEREEGAEVFGGFEIFGGEFENVEFAFHGNVMSKFFKVSCTLLRILSVHSRGVMSNE